MKNQLKLINIINKDFYHSKISVRTLNHTKQILRELLNSLDPKESEEHNKNLIRDFIIKIGYKSSQVNTSGRIDLSISDNEYNHVIIETKDFGNPQMLTTKNINHKAIHELILYFMREYLVHHNQHVTYLIATNGVQWFIFKASDFKKLFINDRKFVEDFKESDVQHSLTDTSTNNFYRNIAKPKVAKIIHKIHYLYFDWGKEFHGKAISNRLATNIYKLFSPITMFKETFVADSNALNVNFYNELLYIMGLREKKHSKGIERLPKHQRKQGSIVELIYYAIQGSYHNKSSQDVFDDVINMAMSFIDRLLFLKLLEGQLIRFNNNKKYSFLNNKKIQSFSDVDDLFFKVLAIPRKERGNYLKERYPYIPVSKQFIVRTDSSRKRISYVANQIKK